MVRSRAGFYAVARGDPGENLPQRELLPMSNEQLGQIVEDSAAEVYIFDARDYRFRLVNRGARENLQYSTVELRDLTPWAIKPDLTQEEFVQMVQPLVRGEVRELKFETRHQRKDGTIYDVSVHLHFIKSEGEEVFFAAIRDVTQERRMARELQAKTEALEQALETKEVLLHEVNHRVKNSLQVVTSLLQLQVNQAKDERLKEALAEARGRVSVVANIHQKLYTTSQHTMVDFGEFLAELVEQTVAHLSAGDQIATHCDLASDISVPLTKGVPLALVVSEILTNCAKYAFPEGRKGNLAVTLHSKDNAMVLTIADDGVGLAQPFGSADGSGLGTRIIKALVQQIRATLDVETGPQGTEFRLQLPLDENA